MRISDWSSDVCSSDLSDVTLAAASNAPIIGFNVRPNAKAREIATREKVRFLYYDVIYHLTEEIAKEMAGELGPERVETVVGRAEIKEVFPAGKQIGRASCRERVCQYVSISVVAVALKKKTYIYVTLKHLAIKRNIIIKV